MSAQRLWFKINENNKLNWHRTKVLGKIIEFGKKSKNIDVENLLWVTHMVAWQTLFIFCSFYHITSILTSQNKKVVLYYLSVMVNLF